MESKLHNQSVQQVTVPRELLASRRRRSSDLPKLREFVSNVSPEIMQFRNKIVNTDSNMIPNILGDVQEGYSPIILVCGRQRLGKTRFAATLANIFQVFLYYEWFDTTNFYLRPRNLLQGIRDEGLQIMILDEAGSSGGGLNKSEWFGELNGLFDYILQTQGNLRNIYIMVLPFASDLTTDIRKYIDYNMAGKKRGQFKAYKIYKREDQLVKNLKDFKQVFIEMMEFKLGDLPNNIWKIVETKCNKIKEESRKEKLNKMFNKKDWLDTKGAT